MPAVRSLEFFPEPEPSPDNLNSPPPAPYVRIDLIAENQYSLCTGEVKIGIAKLPANYRDLTLQQLADQLHSDTPVSILELNG
ncbi:MAG: hypothetical protein OXE84_14530 [Rhodobacteraceae bacterium]|nr:hypothetical protein [Paracoccaceae bacterium]